MAALGHEQRAVIGGDAKSAAIAAASVIAKETRDRYMRRADAAHPGWEFAQHVGYATPEHRDAIERLGVSPLHRLSFQSAAYQQLALAAWASDLRPVASALRTRPPGARCASSRPSASNVTPIASKRSSSAYGRSARSISQLPAILRTCARLARVQRVERAAAAGRYAAGS